MKLSGDQNEQTKTKHLAPSGILKLSHTPMLMIINKQLSYAYYMSNPILGDQEECFKSKKYSP